MDLQHVAGKNNHVADCLSRAVAGAVHLGLDYNRMATDQATDPDVQLLRTSTTGLQIEDVVFGDVGTTLLCDFLMPSMVSPTQVRKRHRDWLQQSLFGTASRRTLGTGLTPGLSANGPKYTATLKPR